MSINHIIDKDIIPKFDLYAKSINLDPVDGIIDPLKFKASNNDVINFSSLPSYGAPSERLTSNGDGTCSWVAGTGTSGIEYGGSIPVTTGQIATYSAPDGSLVDKTTYTESELFLKDGSRQMTGSLNMSGNSIDNNLILNTATIQPNPIFDPVNLNIQADNTNIFTTKLSVEGPLNAWDFFVDGTTPQPEVRLNLLDLNMNTRNILGAKDIDCTTIQGNTGDLDVQSNLNMLGNTLKVDNIQSQLGPGDILFASNINLFSRDIKFGGSCQVTSFEPTDLKQSEIDCNAHLDFDSTFDIRGVKDLSTTNIDAQTTSTNILNGGLSPDITVNSNLDLNGTKEIKGVTNLEVSTINSITPVGGLYCGISDGVVINQASGVTDLLPSSSVGSLSIPANGFKVGDAYHLVIAGIFPDESKGDDVEIEIKQNGTVIGSVTLEYENFDTVESNFELEADFVIRSVGVTGSLASNIDFTFNKKVTKDFKGTRTTSITTINTTTASSLTVTATVTGASSSIQSRLAYLRKQY